MTIQYDGTNLYGWQSQIKERTVQGEIESALKKIFKNQKINLIGSGRTDAGVHALGQVANIKLDSDMSPNEFMNAINGNINNDISIINCEYAINDFSSRFSAIKREYKYKISNNYSPITRKYVWNIKENIDSDKLNKCAELVLGEHDFTLLSKKNDDVKNKVCMIYLSKWKVEGEHLTYSIVGNRFLHHMVRYIVGMMVEVVKNRSISIEDFENTLNCIDRKLLYKAPARGLYLTNVLYE